MKDYRTIYHSKTGRLNEELSEEVFVTDASPKIIDYDRLFCEGLYEVLERDNISPNSTYFIVDICHGHLPGVGVELLKRGIDVFYYIPSKADKRLSQAIAYFAKEHLKAKEELTNPVGYATLIDCYRDIYDGPMKYSLDDSILPTPQQLKELGINKVVLLNELSIEKQDIDIDFILKIANPSGFKQRLLEYKNNGLEVYIKGINKRHNYILPFRQKRIQRPKRVNFLN